MECSATHHQLPLVDVGVVELRTRIESMLVSIGEASLLWGFLDLLLDTEKPVVLIGAMFMDDRTLPRVDIIYAHANEDGELARCAIGLGAREIVLAGFGNGSVSTEMEKVLIEAREKDIVVIRASRTGSGSVYPWRTRWQDCGFIPSGTLSPQEARILLQLLLKKSVSDNETIRKFFIQY